MEAAVQLHDGYTSVNVTQSDITTDAGSTPTNTIGAASAAAAEQLATILTRHADAVTLTLANGGPVWDSAKTTLTNLRITSSSATQMTVTVDVSNVFHIEGQPTNGGPSTISAEENPYEAVLNYVSGEWRLASVQLVVPPADLSTGNGIVEGASNRNPGNAPTAASGGANGTTTFATAYNNAAAYNYAWTWANGYNTAQYATQSNDCMNFVSQIIAAGGEQTGSVWYPESATWVNVEDFWLERRQWYTPDGNVEHPQNSDNSAIHPGDLTAWSWGSQIGNPRPLDHEMYVDDKSGNTLLLAAHTNPRWNYPSYSVYADEPIGTYYLAERPNGM